MSRGPPWPSSTPLERGHGLAACQRACGLITSVASQARDDVHVGSGYGRYSFRSLPKGSTTERSRTSRDCRRHAPVASGNADCDGVAALCVRC